MYFSRVFARKNILTCVFRCGITEVRGTVFDDFVRLVEQAHDTARKGSSMALLALKDVGKIYVSEGNVAVGIRGVNLSFDRGEFVAVTGKSGSGKSTLLNVISGMDSFEEGELYIEGQSTSHYLEPEWEEYRQRYISFIFQDYNIIESFTVLENVELALMHIENKEERRARAMELIARVGLATHAGHKGSKLSGGQKQRTVIARALAKDSPIILADEPTGNLDSHTSREIITLLREVSHDKLVIVVTHSFDELAECATRHVRIYDGAVESDHILSAVTTPTPSASPASSTPQGLSKREERKRKLERQVKNGFALGRTIFVARPKLSLFLCLLMLIGTLGIFATTALCGEAGGLFEPCYMFNHIDGRLVLAKQSGAVFTDAELEAIVREYGAREYLHFDQMLDEDAWNTVVLPLEGDNYIYETIDHYVYGKEYGEVIGRYPTEKDEVLLYLPISYRDAVGKSELLLSKAQIGLVVYDLVGVKYYYDNNRGIECLFTEDGFRTATAIHFLADYGASSICVSVDTGGEITEDFLLYDLVPSFDMPKDKVYIQSKQYDFYLEGSSSYTTTVSYTATYYKYDYNYTSMDKSYTFSRLFTHDEIATERPVVEDYRDWGWRKDVLYISDELLCEIAERVLAESYTQASVFFENDAAARRAAERLQDAGYIAVPSDTTYEPDGATVILTLLGAMMMAFVWVMAILFLSFFISLCSSRAMDAFKGDMAIMRSMGIEVRVIRIGMYVRMLISLVPAFILVVLTAILIFTSPSLNAYFSYLYAWQYALIFGGMIVLTVRATHGQIRRLFGESVKKALKGGSAV